MRVELHRTGHEMHEVIREIGYEIADKIEAKQNNK